VIRWFFVERSSRNG